MKMSKKEHTVVRTYTSGDGTFTYHEVRYGDDERTWTYGKTAYEAKFK